MPSRWWLQGSEEIIPGLVAGGELEKADKLSRLYALDTLHYELSRMEWGEVVRYVRRVTGGLGDREDEPFDVVRMGLAGSVIAWPEALRGGERVLEIGTGVGRTRYAVAVTVETRLYVTIDVDPLILALALYANPVPAYEEALWGREVRVILGDAARILEVLNTRFDHVIHDGGPTPRKNPRLYSQRFLRRIRDLLREGGSLSIFAGADRRWVTRIYNALRSLGFRVEETVHLPGSKAVVIHARRA